jgi:hypothetical protein
VVEAKGERIGNLPIPELPNMAFSALGSSRSSSSSISFVNGRMTSQKTESITFTLRADAVGNFRIPPITVVIDRREYLTRPIDITVSENTSQTQPPRTPGQPTSPQQPRQTTTPDGSEMFLLATADKTNVFRNEKIIVHYKLYTQSQISNVSLGGEPAFSGFWKEDLFQADRLQMQREVFEGRQYNTLLLRSIALFPSREGNLTIPSFDINVDVAIPARSFFDFGSSRRVNIVSRPIEIRVNPLPPIEPERNFIGAVGSFEVSTSLSSNTGEAGSSLTYRITLTGSGNFNQTSLPRIPEVQGLRFLNPETEDVRNRSGTAFTGRRTFIYPVILQESGTFELPEIQITWFDPAQRRYISRTLRTETITATPSQQHIVTAPGAQQTIRVIGRDIQFIITDISTKGFTFFYHTFWYWLIVLILILSLFVHHFYNLEEHRQNTDIKYSRNRRASSLMRKYLREANLFAKKNNIEFYNSAYIGITHFLADKLNLPRGSTEKIIFESLKEKSISENVINDLKATLDKINYVKFSNINVETVDIKADLFMIDNLIQALMREIKK